MNRISLKLKVTLWYTAVMLVVSGIALFAMTSVTQKTINRDMEGKIVRTVEDFSRRIKPDGKESFPPEFHFYEQGVHMMLYDSEHNIIGGQVPFGIEEEFDFSDGALRRKEYGGNLYYEYDRKVKFPNRSELWMKGIMSISDQSYAVKSAAKNNVTLTLILILVAAVGGYMIISRAFVPVERIRQTAKKISESNDLSKRIRLGDGKDEIHALADTFDEMLEKIEGTFEREKQFTSDASHELRTPVSVILSECEYMKACAKTVEDYAESVDAVSRQAEKMQKLISELLTLSRMEQNTQRVSFEETDLSELLTFVCDEQEEIGREGILLKRQIEPGITAMADRVLLARLFINLISNAYQYSKETGFVCVSLKNEGENIVFTVTDNGIGIKEEDIPKIWERFYQADSSRTANENGSMGLGLSMVKWIARCHKGTVTVKSEVGKGSEFTFTFPKNM